MKTISEASLKKAIQAVEAERAKHPVGLRPNRTELAALRKGQRASERMVAEFLKSTGLDMKKFASLQDDRDAELERIVARQKADALKRAARAKDTLHSSIGPETAAWQELAGREDFFPSPWFSLDTPFLIWPTPLLSIDSDTAPLSSGAKFKLQASSPPQGSQKVGFYFYWPNPFNDYAVINAATFISATGHLRAHAPWGLTSHAADITAYAQFGLWVGFPTSPVSSAYTTQYFGDAHAFSSFLLGPETNGASVTAGASLSKALFPVAPGAGVVFEVALVTPYNLQGGDIEADFQTGDFNITCPVVVFSLLNKPPDVMG
jgi:hypothetical protein